MPKKKTSQKSGKQHKKKQQKTLNQKLMVIAAAAVALIAIAFIAHSIYAKHYNTRDHAQDLASDELYQMNYTLTVFGRNNSVIGSNDVLILDTMNKELGADTQITFYIYRYTNESDLNIALKMTAEQIAGDTRFEMVGNGSVTMVNDQIAGMRNMKTTYMK